MEEKRIWWERRREQGERRRGKEREGEGRREKEREGERVGRSSREEREIVRERGGIVREGDI